MNQDSSVKQEQVQTKTRAKAKPKTVAATPTNEDVPKKKAGGRKKTLTPTSAARKPPIVATVTSDGIIGHLSTTSDTRPLIAFMPIQLSDLGESIMTLDQHVPSSYSYKDLPVIPPFEKENHLASYEIENGNQLESIQEDKELDVKRPSLPLYYSEKLLVQFQDANRSQQLPESTEVACFWDSHAFRGTPCVIPKRIEEDIWRVYGNFCCPECAAAYLFNEHLDTHVQWERYALLNRLYSSWCEGSGKTIKLAPSKSVLRLFGGNMDITEYRSILSDKKMRIDVLTPPMISITQTMDTKPIDFYDASVKNNFIPWEMDRMNRPGAQGMRLRRTKPVLNKEATLDWCFS